MTLRIDKIEIQQQPERKRFWADVEVMAPNGFRRKVITTPDDEGYWGMLRAIGEYLDEFLPKPELNRGLTSAEVQRFYEGSQWEAAGNPEAWPTTAQSAFQVRPTHTPDGARLLIADDHTIGDVLRDERGRPWLWELMGLRPYSETPSKSAAPMMPSEFNDVARAELGAGKERADVRTSDLALDALRAEAEAAGVRVDGRWGEARLREEIARGMADQDWQDAQEER